MQSKLIDKGLLITFDKFLSFSKKKKIKRKKDCDISDGT